MAITVALIAQFAIGPDASTVGAEDATSTITVDSTDDLIDDDLGDDICRTDVGTCSLRAAIMTANAMLGSNTVQFAIPGTGVYSISLAYILPVPLSV